MGGDKFERRSKGLLPCYLTFFGFIKKGCDVEFSQIQTMEALMSSVSKHKRRKKNEEVYY